jgi:alpha-L-fucosidase
MGRSRFLAITFVALVCALSSAISAETSAQREARMSWWREARFGLFIHYGPVTLTGGEISWSRANSNPKCPNQGATPVQVYDNLYRQFDPTNFNAVEWAELAKAAGMKYVVLTAKHCDGFLLWNSKVDGYNIMATPFKRDICAELAAAVRKSGVRMGWYFSPMDWRDPEFRTEKNAHFITRMQGELRELLANYGKISVIWFDFDGREALYDQTHTYALVRQLQPDIIIDNRLDLSTGAENTQMLSPYADFYTPEQRIGSYDDQRPWETCMTLGTQWSWKPNDAIKSAPEVISILARTAGGDGNLLLDVGPMPDGRVEPRQADVLKQVGAWMRVNGESIYGTRGGPWKPTATLASTRKGKRIYVHVLKCETGRVELPSLPAKIRSATLLGGRRVNLTQDETKIVLELPRVGLGPEDAVVKLTLDQMAEQIPARTISH